MASAYTPGLTVSSSTTIRKTRRLPLKGDVLVSAGSLVAPETVVARAALPGPLQTIRVASQLGVDAGDVPGALRVKVGDVVEPETLVARTSGLFGLFKSEVKAGVTGTVEIISPVSGNVGVRAASLPIDVTAYVPGTVVEVLPGEGVVVEARGAALIQGIFGIGGERRAPLVRMAKTPNAILDADDLTSAHANKVVVGGGRVTLAALRRAAETGVVGIVCGGIVDTDLAEFLGYDIGVAITGYEDVPFTLVLTEGFGDIAMAQRTFDLLAGLDGREACFSGATQIRAGVLRPEVIVPGASGDAPAPADEAGDDAFTLAIGTPIRLIREPYFGQLATVTALPPELARVPSGAVVRVLRASLNAGGETVTVPRANVEIVAGG